jgi:hypothetical protein
MKEYKVKILDSVFDDIDSLADFIVSVSLPEHAIRYVRELGAEIMTLRYLADVIPQSRYHSVPRQRLPAAGPGSAGTVATARCGDTIVK